MLSVPSAILFRSYFGKSLLVFSEDYVDAVASVQLCAGDLDDLIWFIDRTISLPYATMSGYEKYLF